MTTRSMTRKKKTTYRKKANNYGKKVKKQPWSNSVGTRFTQSRLNNPTVGYGNTNMRTRHLNSHDGLACKAVVMNAFSDATQQPRYPDGKASDSIGFRGQRISE